jgi:histidinol-phosphate aminotransferase
VLLPRRSPSAGTALTVHAATATLIGPMAYERDHFRELTAYAPGEQPQRMRVVKLNTNENPCPPTDAVMQAIRSLDPERLRRYPPPTADGVRTAAARVHGVAPEQVIVTNGGDELLRLAVTVFCEPGASGRPGGLGVAEPSYSLYPVLAAIHATPVTAVALGDDFELPADAAARWNDAGCRAAFIVNPHAPSGRLESLDLLRSLAGTFRGVLLIDEAYMDFAEHDALDLVREGLPNVLLLRSLSKGYSLAGLRVGYGVGSAELIGVLQKARDSYNVDALAQAAAEAALASRDEAARSWALVISERGRVTGQLQQRGFTVCPSQSNFVLATPGPGGLDAPTIYRRLADTGIFVRYFDQDRLRDKLRITIGTPEQNDELLKALDTLL